MNWKVKRRGKKSYRNPHRMIKRNVLFYYSVILFILWVRLNYAIAHHHPPPPTTSQNIFPTIHHHPPPAKIYSPPPTTSQNISTTTHHHPKNGLRPSKSQNIFIHCSFWHCFNSFFFFEMQYFRDGDFVW